MRTASQSLTSCPIPNPRKSPEMDKGMVAWLRPHNVLVHDDCRLCSTTNISIFNWGVLFGPEHRVIKNNLAEGRNSKNNDIG